MGRRKLKYITLKTFHLKVIIIVCTLSFCLFSSNASAQDSASSRNIWFVEYQIAVPEGWTLDIIHGADLSIGGMFLKNISFRINGGFESGKIDNNLFPSYFTPYSNSVYLHSYSGGVDFLYEIPLSQKLVFRTGPGYEYFYSKKEMNSSEFALPEEHERKEFANIYKLVGGFNYNFTKNVYAFVQMNLSFEKHHGSQKDKYSDSKSVIKRDFDFKEDYVRLDNVTLGGGISF